MPRWEDFKNDLFTFIKIVCAMNVFLFIIGCTHLSVSFLVAFSIVYSIFLLIKYLITTTEEDPNKKEW